MRRWRGLAWALFWCLNCARVGALSIALSPGSIDWRSQTWLNITLSNLSAGAAAELRLVVDIDGNGALSGPDVAIARFLLADGRTNAWGSRFALADRDGLSNGVIRTEVPYHNLNSLYHTIGRYLWAASTNGVAFVVQPFAVTQSVAATWITGVVREYTDPSAAVPGALVRMSYFSEALGIEPAVWTDTNGAFRLDLPDEVTAADVRGVFAIARGRLAAPRSPAGEWVSAHAFSGPLQPGENVITQALRVVGPLPGMLCSVSGRVVSVQGTVTNPVPFTLVQWRGDDEEEGPDVWTADVTDAQGRFRLVLPNHASGMLLLSSEVSMRGLAAEVVQIALGTQDLSGVVIRCRPAPAWAKGQVVRASDGAPVPGLPLYVADKQRGVYGLTFSLGDGTFDVGVGTGNDQYLGVLEDDVPWRLGYVAPEEQGPFSIGAGVVYTGLLVELETAYQIRGRVYDSATNALTGGQVAASLPFSWDALSDCDVNFVGEYALPVPAGTYRVAADGFEGYIGQIWSNHYWWEWDNGPVFDPVVVTTDHVWGIDFHLPPAAYIRGTVRGGGVPLAGVNVQAMVDWSWRGGATTREDGTYEIAVLGGTGYVVHAEPPPGTFWLYQYYSNVLDHAAATLVYPQPDAPATNIDFDLAMGGIVAGTLFDRQAGVPLTNTWAVVAGLDFWGNWVNSTLVDPDTGTYQLTLPPGTYRIRAEAPGWLTQYYGGFFEYQWQLAPVVPVAAEEIFGGVNVTMIPPSYIMGEVRGAGQPLEDVQVEVHYVPDRGGQWIFVAQATSDDAGRFDVEVPPGTNFGIRALPDPASGFVEQWWSNAPSVETATLLTVGREAIVSNIVFDLALGMRISGRVLDENGTPVTNAAVEIWRAENGFGNWVGQVRTDSEGRYVISAPATTTHVVMVRRPWETPLESWWYPDQFYSNAYLFAQATRLWTNAGQIISNVDFRLQPGFHFTGRVVRAIGGSPIAAAQVIACLSNAFTWLTSVPADDQGGFGLCLPANQLLYARAEAVGFGIRWYSNSYDFAGAVGIVAPPYSVRAAEFRLAAHDEDVDGDGFNEYEETVATRTDPLNPSDYLRVADLRQSGTNVIVRWMTRPGVTYWVERCENLARPTWIIVAGPEWGDGTVRVITNAPIHPSASYRLAVPAP